MDDAAKRRADEVTETAISHGPYQDFREAYRIRLRWLKDNRPQQFAEALSHYNDVLVPNIAGGNDPVREWIEYGLRLGQLSGSGKTVAVDETGRAFPFAGQVDGLILHLPEDTATPALALAVPRQLSEAQQATLQLLVGKSQFN